MNVCLNQEKSKNLNRGSLFPQMFSFQAFTQIQLKTDQLIFVFSSGLQDLRFYCVNRKAFDNPQMSLLHYLVMHRHIFPTKPLKYNDPSIFTNMFIRKSFHKLVENLFIASDSFDLSNLKIVHIIYIQQYCKHCLTQSEFYCLEYTPNVNLDLVSQI